MDRSVLLRGCFRILLFYDVGEAFDPEKLRDLLGSRGGSAKPDFPRHTPDYVRFENAPIAEPSEPVTLRTGEQLICSIKYYAQALVEVRIAPAVIKPREEWLQEDYLVVDLREIQGEGGAAVTADELLSAHGEHIAQLIRGEQTRLARTTTEHVLQASLSYYPSDLLVVGSSAALVYDRLDDAAWTIQILEYTKM